jgi:hypothetical protein
LKSTETPEHRRRPIHSVQHFSNFGSLKSTETYSSSAKLIHIADFSNFGSLKSTETACAWPSPQTTGSFQQFRLVEEH